MRKLSASLLTLTLIGMFLWAASPVYAGEAQVSGDCYRWTITIETLGSDPAGWTVTLDGQPVEDGTHIVYDTTNVTRTFEVVWTRDGRQDIKHFTGQRDLSDCGCIEPIEGGYDPCIPTTTTTLESTTTTKGATTTIPTTTSTSPTPTLTSTPPSTLPFTGINPIRTGGTGIALLLAGGLLWLTAKTRTE